MRPWWDNTWLWSGIGIVTASAIAGIVAIIIIVALSNWFDREQS
jgi:hypothetical protein